MTTKMRAKMIVNFVQDVFWGPKGEDGKPTKSQEMLTFSAVCAPTYDPSGMDEDNTFAKFSPGADLRLNVANPDLWGKFKVGQKFYLDFTEVE